MATYGATLTHGRRGGERMFEFEGPEDLMDHSPMTVMRTFMAHLDETADLGHIDYHVNAALKNDKYQVVTVLGELVFGKGDHQPFMCMISPV
ncbi:MAG: hypothetical protein CML66_15625 [Rhodobacteraceae bacterium]|nr:hypothetical protein [Paracoccaceae bacterium]MAY44536.1 hypothetical protein [Paracoccaceae bacterium]QEW18243.1 hypothetical protein LA6_000405 [Marinibacterium anthonyi]